MQTVFDRFRIRPLWAAFVVCLMMTAVLAYMVESRASILRYGTEVRLRTAPVDPRDFLRGDYVTLNYDIADLRTVALDGERPKGERHAVVYVRLRAGVDGFWAARSYSFSPLPPADGTVVLKSQPFDYERQNEGAITNVHFGIERYYVPEGQGREIEDSVSSADLAVIIKVSGSGIGQIARLELQGRPLYEEPLY
jgi:uncharacterized membrane-anchored protein